MFNNNYGNERRLKARFIGVDIATGQAQDYTALCLIDQFEEKILKDSFEDTYETIEKYRITDLQRTRDLNLDLQVQWLRSYIEALRDPKPAYISIDCTRELGTCLNLRTALPGYRVAGVVWTGGSKISREGLKYTASKPQTMQDLKGFVSLGRLTVANIPLRDELVRELEGFTLEDNPTGGLSIKPPTGHDDLAMALAACCVPLFERRILERMAPRAIPNPFQYQQVVYIGANHEQV